MILYSNYFVIKLLLYTLTLILNPDDLVHRIAMPCSTNIFSAVRFTNQRASSVGAFSTPRVARRCGLVCYLEHLPSCLAHLPNHAGRVRRMGRQSSPRLELSCLCFQLPFRLRREGKTMSQPPPLGWGYLSVLSNPALFIFSGAIIHLHPPLLGCRQAPLFPTPSLRWRHHWPLHPRRVPECFRSRPPRMSPPQVGLFQCRCFGPV